MKDDEIRKAFEEKFGIRYENYNKQKGYYNRTLNKNFDIFKSGWNKSRDKQITELEERLDVAVDQIEIIRDFSMSSTAITGGMIFNMCEKALSTIKDKECLWPFS